MSEGAFPVRLSIAWPPEAQADLRAVDRQTALDILHCIDRYLADRQGDVKKLKPPMTGFRLRCGDYRISSSRAVRTALPLPASVTAGTRTAELPRELTKESVICYWFITEGRLYIGSMRKDYSSRHIYRTRKSVRAFWLVFLAASLSICYSAWRGIQVSSVSWLGLIITIMMFIVSVWLFAQTFTARVVLSVDSIHYGNFFSEQSMRLDQIRYRREYEEYQDGAEGGINVSYLELVPYDGTAKPLKIPKDDFNFDEVFWAHIIPLPDFDDVRTKSHTEQAIPSSSY